MQRLIFFLVLLAVISPLAVSAAACPVLKKIDPLNLNYPNFGGYDLNDKQNLVEVVAYVYYFIVGISGLAAFVMLVWGGIQWLTSGAIPSQAGEARDKIKNAILGLLLVLASFLIIQIINPGLTIISVTC